MTRRMKRFTHAPFARNSKKGAGFTFIEILVAVTVLILLAVLAVPFYLNFYHFQQLDSTANEIIQTLRKAQAESLAGKDNSNWGVYFGTLATAPDKHFFDLWKEEGIYNKPNESDCKSDINCYILPSKIELDTNGLDSVEKDLIIFVKLTGVPKPNNTGDIEIKIKGTDGSSDRDSITVNINSLGRIERK